MGVSGFILIQVFSIWPVSCCFRKWFTRSKEKLRALYVSYSVQYLQKKTDPLMNESLAVKEPQFKFLTHFTETTFFFRSLTCWYEIKITILQLNTKVLFLVIFPEACRYLLATSRFWHESSNFGIKTTFSKCCNPATNLTPFKKAQRYSSTYAAYIS